MFKRMLSELIQSRRVRAGRRRSNCRLQGLESLEDRRLLTFSPAVDYSVGNNPQAIVTADFNGDGRLDVATGNSSSSNVSVLIGNANGTFQPAQNSATGSNPRSIAVGDFNADGKLDIATANVDDVSVLLGNGNGTFGAPRSLVFSDGSSPSSVAVGDFNGDGKLDLGVTSNVYDPGYSGSYAWTPPSYLGRANVLLGNGRGEFASPLSSFGYGYFTSAILEDFNGDGKDEFASAIVDAIYYSSGYIQLFTGTDASTLGTPTYVYDSNTVRLITAGDVNSDGKLDLVAAVANPTSNSVGIYLGTGIGSFGTAQLFDSARYSASISLSDFNSDSKIDILAANSDNGTVSVLLGTGDGAFRSPLSTATGASPMAVAVGDFNADGRTDVASANAGTNSASVLLNDGAWISVDAPSLTISNVTVTEGNTGTTAATFTVSLSSASSQTVTVQYSTADVTATSGSDYQAKTGTLTFIPGDTSKTIEVLVNGDRAGENDEMFSVLLTNATNAFVSSALGVGAIEDDEPFISIATEATVMEGNTLTRPIDFTVTLSAAYDAPVTVEYTTSDLTDYWIYYFGYTSATAGVDYQPNSGTLTFAKGQTSQTITVLVNGDRVGEMTEYFLVDLSNPNGAKLSSLQSQSLASIVDDEPTIRLDGRTVVEGNSGTKTLAFVATLSAASDVPVTVAYATFDGSAVAGSDYVGASGTLTIPAGETSGTIPVSIKGDLAPEFDEYFSMQLSDPMNAGIEGGWASGGILDDDTPPSITIYGDGIYEGNSGTKLLTFTVSLSQVSGKTVSVNYATVNDTARTSDRDYVAKTGSLTFAPGETTKTISVVINGDTKREKNEYFYVTLTRPINGTIATARATGTILNDDGGNSRQNQSSFTSAIDLVFEEIATGRSKKRGR